MFFTLIVPIIDPFDRLVKLGALEGLVSKCVALKGDHEIIFVNNNSVLGTPILTNYLRELAIKSEGAIKNLEPNKNLGIAGGLNLGLKNADTRFKYAVFVSSDADPIDASLLLEMGNIMEEHPEIGIAHPMSVFEDFECFNVSSKYGLKAVRNSIRKRGSESPADISDYKMRKILKKVKRAKSVYTNRRMTPGTFSIYRRSMIERIGAFDDRFLACCETDDICYRALLNGYSVVCLNRLFVNHRRLMFRELVLGGTPELARLPHSNIISESQKWWVAKWGRPYIELYAELRYGKKLFKAMEIYFMGRRFAGRIKRLLYQLRGM